MTLKSKIDWFLKGTAHHFTMHIGFKYGNRLPMYFVSGFPRSGTSWLSELVADCTNLPRPRHYYLPLAFASIVHTHWIPDKRFKKTFYIYRDGRDCYVSAFNKLIKLRETGSNDVLLKRMEAASPNIFDTNLQSGFYNYLVYRLNTNKYNWANHVSLSLENAEKYENIVALRYEELLLRPEEALLRAFSGLKEDNLDREIIRNAIDANSFSKQVRRPVVQHRTELNKGTQGTWRHYFNREAAELFDARCGKVLRSLGYEKDMNWIGNVSDEAGY